MPNKFLCHLLIYLITISFTFISPASADAAILLKTNSRGIAVTQLQLRLISLNYSIKEIDGVYGQETQNAVRAFQRAEKLPQTGYVDGTTWSLLKQKVPTLPALPKKSRSKLKQPVSKIPTKNPTTNKKKSSVKTPSVLKLDPNLGIPANVTISHSTRTTPTAAAVIRTAKQYIGTPYKFGGVTPKGFDCSGYMQFIYNKNHISLPRTADLQYETGFKVSVSTLQPGDMVFFSTYEKGASHCGMFVGDGKFIHTSTSKGVRIDELSDNYWRPRYLGARRILK